MNYEHIYIYEKNSKFPVVKVKDEDALASIKKLTKNFDDDYEVKDFPEAFLNPDWLGYYQADWEPFIER